MPRKSAPWYRLDRQMWFFTDKGKQIPLGVSGPGNEQLAIAALAKLLAGLQPAPAQPPAQTVAELVPVYLATRTVKKTSLDNYRHALTHFARVAGHLVPGNVTSAVVEAASARPSWGPSTRCNFVGDVLGFLKWCGVTLKVKKPRKRSRGAKAALSAAQFAAVMELARNPPGRMKNPRVRDDWPAYLTVLWETGARPQEIATLTAEEVDWDNRLVRRQEHKEEETGDRVIHFPAAAMAVLEAQRAKWPTGFLFRTRFQKHFRKREIVRRMLIISEAVGFRVTAYSCRHSWATKALIVGVPDVVVAALLGHKGTAMLTMHYSHVSANAAVLKAAAERASAGAA